MSETPALGLPLLDPEQAQKHVTHNHALGKLDALVQLAVIDRGLGSPPAAEDGDRYLVADLAADEWQGHDGEIATWMDGDWEFHQPRPGWLCWVADEETLLVFDGSAWVELAATLDSFGGLELLGIGTSADSQNPFSAKLNKALWTAKTVAEGGDGDLRYTLNKESAADVLSILLQVGFSGRAELGLISDDDVTLKVSADGALWRTALLVDRVSGKLTHLGQLQFPAVQNASSDANCLDDYAEGSWTPALTFGTPGNLAVTYSLRAGTYVKIGRLVTVTFAMITSAFTHTSASGSCLVSGLPFTMTSSIARPVGALTFGGITKAGYTSFVLQGIPGGTTLAVVGAASGVTPSAATAADMPTGGSVVLRGTIQYEV